MKKKIEMAKKSPKEQPQSILPAERTGFEKSLEFFLEALNPFHSCGENRIRTCEPVLPATRFPGVPLQPLEHLSNRKAGAKVAKKSEE